jgi:hypothetical protein
MRDQFDREEEAISDALERGDITQREYNQQMSDLQRDYRDATYEAGERAREEELERW